MAKKQEEIVQTSQEFDPDTCAFKTMDDYDQYNKWARRNKRPVRVPGEDFWPKVKVKFSRMDHQQENVLKARCRNREIDWQGQLKSGCIYDLPKPVIKFLTKLAVPIYSEVQVNDGSTRTETKQTGEQPRFSCQILDF